MNLWYTLKNYFKLTNSMQQSPSWKGSSLSVGEEMSRILWNPTVNLHWQQLTICPYSQLDKSKFVH